jgi:hypothetical protein
LDSNLVQRNLQRLQVAQANYLDARADAAQLGAGDTWGFYRGFGTYQAAKHCVECPNGDFVFGDKESMQTNGAVREGQKIMVHQVAGGQPIFYSMPR